MSRRWLALLLCMALAVTTAACRMEANNKPAGSTDRSDAVQMPELPEKLETGADGVPVIEVYNVGNQSIERMSVEKYLEGVLAGEMKNDWPLEALKAQAILARTFVLKFVSTKKSKYKGADISTDVTEAQAYDAGSVNDRVKQAIKQTRGMVMSAGGELPYAWFHAHSGGTTEMPSAALEFEGEDPGYLAVRPVEESDKAPADVKHWSAAFTKTQIKAACADVGVAIEDASSVEIGKTGKSGRAITLVIDGKEISAPAFRLALGASKLKSTLIEDIQTTKDKVMFTGRGFGHGVGMSQWGAYELAEQGRDAEEIVKAFFDGTRIVRMWD